MIWYKGTTTFNKESEFCVHPAQRNSPKCSQVFVNFVHTFLERGIFQTTFHFTNVMPISLLLLSCILCLYSISKWKRETTLMQLFQFIIRLDWVYLHWHGTSNLINFKCQHLVDSFLHTCNFNLTKVIFLRTLLVISEKVLNSFLYFH